MQLACESPAPSIRDARYLEAWEEAPETFKRQASKLGIAGPDLPPSESKAMAYEEGYLTASYTPDMAETIDSQIDKLVEQHGGANERLIIAICEALKEPIKRAAEQESGLAVIRIACLMINTKCAQLLPRIHALLHAIPGLASINGLSSLRESSRKTGVSVEWIRKSRADWCHRLGIPIPAESSKKPEACEKMRQNALTNHFRTKKMRAPIQTNPTLCPPNPIPTSPPTKP